MATSFEIPLAAIYSVLVYGGETQQLSQTASSQDLPTSHPLAATYPRSSLYVSSLSARGGS